MLFPLHNWMALNLDMTMKKMRLPLRLGFAVMAALCSVCGCSSADLSHGDLAAKTPARVGAACTMPINYTSVADEQSNYRIRPGDDLMVTFYLSPEFDTGVTVRPDGKIAMRIGGDIEAANLTPAQLAAAIDRVYSQELREPQAAVVVKNTPSRLVYVEGQVGKPGAIPLVSAMTAMGAISQAGGFTDGAGTDKVILIRRDACGEPQGERLDLAKVIEQQDNQEDAALLPADIIVVPRSRIANLDLFVKQYVRDVLPVEPYLSVTPF
jgi:protein involved in polysaccharide export with SLBB domain